MKTQKICFLHLGRRRCGASLGAFSVFPGEAVADYRVIPMSPGGGGGDCASAPFESATTVILRSGGECGDEA